MLTNKNVVKYGDFLARLVVGLIFIFSGIGKLFGPMPGIEGFTGMLTGLGIPLPGAFAVIVGIVELVGGILLIIGFLDNWAALLLSIVILVAIVSVHITNGWNDFRYPLLLFFVLIKYIGTKFYIKDLWTNKTKN